MATNRPRQERSRGAEPDRFDTTRWSIVLAAGNRGTESSQHALTALCGWYWPPIYAYVRRRVKDTHEAQELTQAFFAELLEKNFIGSARPERGRFRAFLLTSCRNFLSKQWRKSKALRRGGGRVVLSLDFEGAAARCDLEPYRGLTAEQLFDRQWAVTLLDKVMQRLESEANRSGKTAQFEQLRGFLIGDHPGVTYAVVAKELQMTESAARMAARRLRIRYRQLLRDEISETVPEPGDVDDEIRDLFAALEN